MKIKNLIAGLALSLTMGAGVFASVGLSQNAKEASAVNAGTEIYLDVSGGNWFSDSAKVAIWNHQGSCF